MPRVHNHRVLLTGATGFVGNHLFAELKKRGHEVVCVSRDDAKARARWPERHWVRGDTNDTESMKRALEGCDVAYYLVHGMAASHGNFRRDEARSARKFADAAAQAGVERIVYLGGIAPEGPPSEHLASRLEVGELLRAGAVPTLELRASMIVGHGSLSWLIVRDLAARLPAMVLPRWLKSRTQPVAVRDVVAALAGGLTTPLAKHGATYDLPGPETMTGHEILDRTAEALGLQSPVAFEVPLLSPWLSSQWVHLVTRADWKVAREVVVGLTDDIVARDAGYWARIHHARLQRFDDAAHEALAAERAEAGAPRGVGGLLERCIAAVRSGPRLASAR